MTEEGPYRITYLDCMSASTIRETNLSFLQMDEMEYDVMPGRTKLRTRKEIRRVTDDNLNRLFEEFPTETLLHEQCALWVHAVAGKHYFPDANHRTAIATLRELLQENGLDEYVHWPERFPAEAITESKTIRGELSIDLSTLYRRDELFEHWLNFFDEAVNHPE